MSGRVEHGRGVADAGFVTVKAWLPVVAVLAVFGGSLAVRAPGSGALDRAAAVRRVAAVIPDIAIYRRDNQPGSRFDPDLTYSGPLQPEKIYGLHDRGYAGMTADEVAVISELRRGSGFGHEYDSGVWISPHDPGFPAAVTGVIPTVNHYCVLARVGGWYAWQLDRDGPIVRSTDAAYVCQPIAYSP